MLQLISKYGMSEQNPYGVIILKTYLALIIPLMSMNIHVNMANMQYHQR